MAVDVTADDGLIDAPPCILVGGSDEGFWEVLGPQGGSPG